MSMQGDLGNDGLAKLEKIGFRKSADWRLEAGLLECLFHEHETAQNILYAFVCERTVLYIGKTVGSLKRRMYGYRRPMPTQSTNIKSNRLIIEVLRDGRDVDIYALPDNGSTTAASTLIWQPALRTA